jgi:hypothetical protein
MNKVAQGFAYFFIVTISLKTILFFVAKWKRWGVGPKFYFILLLEIVALITCVVEGWKKKKGGKDSEEGDTMLESVGSFWDRFK